MTLYTLDRFVFLWKDLLLGAKTNDILERSVFFAQYDITIG